MKKGALIVGLAFILITCSKKDPTPNTASQCQITSYFKTDNIMRASNPYAYSTTQTATYNAQNLIAGFDVVTDFQYTSGTKVKNSTSRTYEYDANGFVTTETNQFSSDGNGGLSVSDTYNYEYINNVLTKSTQKNTTINGSTSYAYTTVKTYEYNKDGKISKTTSNTTYATGAEAYAVLYEYTNGLLSKVTEDDGAAGSTSSQVEVNSRGLITKEVYSISENHYQYDAEGNLIRKESWQTNKKTGGYTYEYDTKVNADRQFYPTKKGWSQTNLYGSYNDFPTHNITKYTYYDGSDVVTGGGLYTYEYNSHDYPTTVSYTSTSTSSQSQGSTTYTYKNCQ